MPLTDSEKIVYVYYWKPSPGKSVGHVGLETFWGPNLGTKDVNKPGLYISFHDSGFQSKKYDDNTYASTHGGLASETIVLHSLDVPAISQAVKDLLGEHIPIGVPHDQLSWGYSGSFFLPLFGRNKNCCSMVHFCLVRGGIRNLYSYPETMTRSLIVSGLTSVVATVALGLWTMPLRNLLIFETLLKVFMDFASRIMPTSMVATIVAKRCNLDTAETSALSSVLGLFFMDRRSLLTGLSQYEMLTIAIFSVLTLALHKLGLNFSLDMLIAYIPTDIITECLSSLPLGILNVLNSMNITWANLGQSFSWLVFFHATSCLGSVDSPSLKNSFSMGIMNTPSAVLDLVNDASKRELAANNSTQPGFCDSLYNYGLGFFTNKTPTVLPVLEHISAAQLR